MERLRWIDTSKGIGILLVVLGHSIIYASNKDPFWSIANSVIYSFHMPLFFFISAYLQGYTESKNDKPYGSRRIWIKLTSIGIPYFVFSFVYWISKIIMSSTVKNPVTILDFIYCPVFPLSTLWFVYALLCYWMLRLLAYKFKIPNKVMIISCLVISILAYSIDFTGALSLTVIPRLMRNSIYYALGIELSKIEMISAERKPCVWRYSVIGVAILIIGNVVIAITTIPLKGILEIITAIGGIMFVCSMSDVIPETILSKLGKNSLGIYLTHDYIVCLVVIVLRKLIINSSIIVITTFILGTMISYWIYLICIKNNVLKFIFQPQKLLFNERKEK